MVRKSYRPTSCAQALATQPGTQMLARMSQPHLAAWWPVEQRFDFLRKCCKLNHIQHFKFFSFQKWQISNYPDPRLALVYGYAGVESVGLNKVSEYLELLRNYILGLHGRHQCVIVIGPNFELGGWSRTDRRLSALKKYVEKINLERNLLI